MDLNRVSLLFILVILTLSKTGHGQQLELGINLYTGMAHTQGWEPGMNGASLNFDYLQGVTDGVLVKGGIESGLHRVGQPGASCHRDQVRWSQRFGVEILNGMAFYQQGPNYVFGAGAAYTRSLFNEGKNRLLLSIGLRFTIQPAYRSHGPIYSYFDIPVSIRWGRVLK